jgi:hypothetical protein
MRHAAHQFMHQSGDFCPEAVQQCWGDAWFLVESLYQSTVLLLGTAIAVEQSGKCTYWSREHEQTETGDGWQRHGRCAHA